MSRELYVEQIIIKKLTNPLTGLESICNIGLFPSRLEGNDILLLNSVISAFIPQGYQLIADLKYPEKADELLVYLTTENISHQIIKVKQGNLNLFNRQEISHIFFICSQKTLIQIVPQFWPGLTLDTFSFYVVPHTVTVEEWTEQAKENKPLWAHVLGVLYELHQGGDPNDLYLTVNVDPAREVRMILQQVAQEAGLSLSARQIAIRPLTLL